MTGLLKTTRLVALVAAVGFSLGAFLPIGWPGSVERAHAATVYVILYGHPGAGQTMNCGWHTACVGDPPTFGSALDWANSGGAYVNWRSFGYRSDNVPSPLGSGTINTANGTCKALEVPVVDAYGTPRGGWRYVHSESSWAGASFNIPANGVAYGSWHAGAVGTTSSTELTACATDPDGSGPQLPLWTGAHLHQEPMGGATQNTAAYCTPVQGNDCEGTTHPNYLTAGWQHAYKFWAWVI